MSKTIDPIYNGGKPNWGQFAQVPQFIPGHFTMMPRLNKVPPAIYEGERVALAQRYLAEKLAKEVVTNQFGAENLRQPAVVTAAHQEAAAAAVSNVTQAANRVVKMAANVFVGGAVAASERQPQATNVVPGNFGGDQAALTKENLAAAQAAVAAAHSVPAGVPTQERPVPTQPTEKVEPVDPDRAARVAAAMAAVHEATGQSAQRAA